MDTMHTGRDHLRLLVLLIAALGDKDIETIVREMRALIPAENEHWRKLGMAEKLQRHEFLDTLGVIESNAVDVRVEREETPITLTAPLKLPVNVRLSRRRDPGWVIRSIQTFRWGSSIWIVALSTIPTRPR